MKKHFSLSIGLYALLSACVTVPTPAERKATAEALAQSKGWHAEQVHSGGFDVLAYLPVAQKKTDRLTVYIEGDGLAWVTESLASIDPTPRNPLALRLALAQPEGSAVYLARPCQYVDAEATGCAQRYWTTARFAEEVVAASDAAIDTLKRRFQAKKLVLVGYSGGAAIAALIAARRQDIALLVSVAGNLDPFAWTRYHHLQTLSESLNPVDAAEGLRQTPSVYLAGENDRNITPELVLAYALRLSGNRTPTVFVVPGFDHQCCWAEEWPVFWRRAEALASPD